MVRSRHLATPRREPQQSKRPLTIQLQTAVGGRPVRRCEGRAPETRRCGDYLNGRYPLNTRVSLRLIAGAQRLPHTSAMNSGPTKSEQMELRRGLGNRKVPMVVTTPLHRGPECLWPHACFDCHKSWKRPEGTTAKCPECWGSLRWMGRAFKVPKRDDAEQWAKVRALWFAGFRFINHTCWRDAEPFPDRLREVEDFIRRNPHHPFRTQVADGS